MSNGTKLLFEVELDDKSLKSIESDLEEVFRSFQKFATKLGASIPEQFGKTMDGLYKQVGKNYEKLSESLGNTAQSAIVDSIGLYFRGEMDKVEDIWHTAWDSMTLAAGVKNRLIRATAGLLFITIMVINNKPHPASDSGDELALGPINTRPADDYHLPAVCCVAA